VYFYALFSGILFSSLAAPSQIPYIYFTFIVENAVCDFSRIQLIWEGKSM